ncbi:MAG: hypothetical protein M3463_04265 [Verrucomicrobiota bacterium]|nr:hypothetical protein [Verrucomicrobiota bacterium]
MSSSGGATKSSNALKLSESDKIQGFQQRKDSNFSDVRTKRSGVGLQVEVRNLSAQADAATLEWFFLAKQVEGKPGANDAYIFNHGSQAITIAGGTRQIVPVESPDLESKVEKKLTLRSGYRDQEDNLPSGSVRKSGSKLSGWIVRLVANWPGVAGSRVEPVSRSSRTGPIGAERLAPQNRDEELRRPFAAAALTKGAQQRG